MVFLYHNSSLLGTVAAPLTLYLFVPRLLKMYHGGNLSTRGRDTYVFVPLVNIQVQCAFSRVKEIMSKIFFWRLIGCSELKFR